LNNPSVLILYDSGHGCTLFLVESSLQPTSYYANKSHESITVPKTEKLKACTSFIQFVRTNTINKETC